MKRKLKGKIVSNKMTKTVVVAVEKLKEHPLYKKKYTSTARFKAHVENSADYNVGDVVVIEESKPISKDKKWIVINESNKV